MSVRTGVDEYNQPISDINSGYIGEFKYFGFESVPPHCLACDGSAVSRETYSELFEVFGETFGAGDGTTTFNLPDLRGRFMRCIGGENAAELGEPQADAIRNITGTWSIRYMEEQSPISVGGGLYRISRGTQTTNVIANGTGSATHAIVTFDASQVVPTAAEVRPVNVAVNICVVYE